MRNEANNPRFLAWNEIRYGFLDSGVLRPIQNNRYTSNWHHPEIRLLHGKLRVMKDTCKTVCSR
uniref:Uncharacterized protein n=1 Tax=mine drainage metagenome TaxID=410659 RepID=E6PSS8_9ZZZZ